MPAGTQTSVSAAQHNRTAVFITAHLTYVFTVLRPVAVASSCRHAPGRFCLLTVECAEYGTVRLPPLSERAKNIFAHAGRRRTHGSLVQQLSRQSKLRPSRVGPEPERVVLPGGEDSTQKEFTRAPCICCPDRDHLIFEGSLKARRRADGGGADRPGSRAGSGASQRDG
eukprot:6004155-Prymnesium_polylepis.2